MADRTFAKFTFFKLDPAWQRRDAEAAGAGQTRVPRRLRGLRPGPLAARLLDGRHARRHRPAAAHPEPDPRGHPHLPRRARAERPRALGDDPPLLPGDDQALALLGVGGAARDLHLASASTSSSTRWTRSASGTRCRSRSASGSWPTTSRSAAAIPRSRSTPPTRSGIDDQEFVVSFEGDEPGDFLDLVQELRGTESSSYTLRDTPIFTCVAMSVGQALDALDGAADGAATGRRRA